MTTATVTPALLPLREAAHLLGVRETYLRRSDVPRLALPSTRPNGRPTIRYDREAILAWARSHRLGGGP